MTMKTPRIDVPHYDNWDFWDALAADIPAKHLATAEMLLDVRRALNLAGSDQTYYYGMQAEGKPYWHVHEALRFALVKLTGSEQGAARVDELCLSNGENVAYNLAEWRKEVIRSRTVTVDVYDDGATADIHHPAASPYFSGRAGRMGTQDGLLWVADETEEGEKVIGHAPTWTAAALLLATHHGLPPDTPVEVNDPTATSTTAVSV